MSGHAIVTGSSGGIGTAIAHKLVGAGYQVLGLDSKKSELVETAVVDLASPDFLDSIPKLDLGEVSLVVHCAAHQPAQPISELHFDDWDRTFKVNLFSVQKIVAKYFEDLSKSRGTVICISSIHGQQTSPKMAAYASSKAALDSWVRSAAIEYGPNVAVIGLALGAIDTPKLREGLERWPAEQRTEVTERLISKTPIGRLGSAEEVSDWVDYLAKPSARFASGSIIPVNGGVSAWLGSE